MFTTRTILSLVRAAKTLKNVPLFTQNMQMHAFRKPPVSPSFSLLGYEAKIAAQRRNYAKSKDRKKEKGKTKVQVNETLLSEVVDVEPLKKQMQQAIETLKDEFTKHLSLRSTTGSIESLVVNVDGEDHTLQEVAQISRKNPKTVIINMSVFPQAIPAAVKALSESGMNLNPQQEGTTLYIPIPKVTKEHRENLAKGAKAHFVKCKDKIRDIQNRCVKGLKKKSNVSEDLAHSAQEQVVAIADSYINEAENTLTAKQNELLGK